MIYLFQTGMKRQLQLFNLLVAEAPSFKEALSTYNNLENELSAKILIALTNYAVWDISDISLVIINGINLSNITQVFSGKKGGWVSYNKPHEQHGTEGYAMWKMGTHSSCVIYWKVQHKTEERSPNSLTVGCRSADTTLQVWQHIIIEKGLAGSSEYLVSQTYSNSRPVIQFCDDRICVQGIMTSSNHAVANIEVFPRNATDVTISLRNLLDQKTIDRNIQKQNNTVENIPLDSSNQDIIIISSLITFVVISTFVSCIYEKIRRFNR